MYRYGCSGTDVYGCVRSAAKPASADIKTIGGLLSVTVRLSPLPSVTVRCFL